VTTTQHRGEVKLVRWPVESARRDRYRALGILRLLVVEGGVPAPVSSDVREDWVRAPVTDEDLKARVASLRAKAEAHRLPHVDPNGVLRYAGRSITISRTETDLLECLVRQFGVLVTREMLRDCLPDRPGGASRNALDLHIMRVRRRIRPIGLVIRTVWGRGYLLEADQAQPDADRARHHAQPVREADFRAQPVRETGIHGHDSRLGDRHLRPLPYHDGRVPAGSVRRGHVDDHEPDGGRPLVAAEVAALRWAKARRLAAC
jgi:DNA-binding winged helix-turn-helix (wHTH) protein